MSKTMSHNILRGAKVSVLLLVSLLFISIGSMISPRSAHAEGFLTQTVKCLVQTALLTRCETGRPSSSEQPAQPSTTPSGPGSINQGTTTGTDSSTEPIYPKVSPISEEDMALQALPPGVDTLSSSTHSSNTGNTLAALHYYSQYSMVDSGGEKEVLGVISQSRDGWRIAGVAWYWWTFFIALCVGTLIYIRRRRSRLM